MGTILQRQVANTKALVNAHHLACISLGLTLGAALLLLPEETSAQHPRTAGFTNLKSRAEKASHENRLDEAAHLYGQALRLRPRWADGWWSLGTLEYDRDQYLE